MMNRQKCGNRMVISGDTNEKSPVILCPSCSDRRHSPVSLVSGEKEGVPEQDIV